MPEPLTDQEDKPSRSQASSRGPYALYAIVMALYLVRASFLLTSSAITGRLSIPAPYDDISYFVDALRAFRIFSENGTMAFLRDLGVTNVHAPLSLLLGFLGFGLFGAREFAPYLLNAVVIALCVAGFIRLCRTDLKSGVVTAVIIAALPYNDWAITFFHPDFLAGLIVALFCMEALSTDIVSCDKTRVIALAVLAAFGVLSKPTAFPIVMMLYGTTFVCIAVNIGLAKRRGRAPESTPGLLLRNIVLFAAVMLGIMAPYIVTNGSWLLPYIYLALVEHQVVAGVEGSFWHKATYYAEATAHFFGAGLYIALGCAVLLALGRFPIGWDHPIVRKLLSCHRVGAGFYRQHSAGFSEHGVDASRKNTHPWGLIGGLATLCAASYVLTSLPTVKLYIFGCYIYAFLIAFLVVALCSLLSPANHRNRTLNWFAGIMFAIVAITNYHDIQYRPDRRMAAAENTVFAHLNTLLLDQFRTADMETKRPPLVFFLYPSPLPRHDLLFSFLRNGVRLEDVGSFTWYSDLDIFFKPANTIDTIAGFMAKANLVVVPDAETVTALKQNYPINALIPQINRYLFEHPAFRLIDTIVTSFGKIYVYQHDTP